MYTSKLRPIAPQVALNWNNGIAATQKQLQATSLIILNYLLEVLVVYVWAKFYIMAKVFCVKETQLKKELQLQKHLCHTNQIYDALLISNNCDPQHTCD